MPRAKQPPVPRKWLRDPSKFGRDRFRRDRPRGQRGRRDDDTRVAEGCLDAAQAHNDLVFDLRRYINADAEVPRPEGMKSQRWLAEQVGVSPQTIERIFAGESHLQVWQYMALQAVLRSERVASHG